MGIRRGSYGRAMLVTISGSVMWALIVTVFCTFDFEAGEVTLADIGDIIGFIFGTGVAFIVAVALAKGIFETTFQKALLAFGFACVVHTGVSLFLNWAVYAFEISESIAR